VSDAQLPAEPLPHIRGERIFLRAAERSDLPTFVAWFNDQRVSGYLTVDTPMSLAWEEGWFDRLQALQGKTVYHFVICLRESGQPIGTIGLHDVDPKHGTAEVGISIGDPALWGQGLGSEAMSALLDYGFGTLRLERIQLLVYDFNARARRSYEKVGFVLEGTLRKALYRNGRRRDIHLMAVLRDEWLADDRPRSWEVP
jgi:RimJ/RimL family protein N-acetyltransferase